VTFGHLMMFQRHCAQINNHHHPHQEECKEEDAEARRMRLCPGSFDDMAFQWRWLLMRLFAPSANNNAFKTTITQ